MQPLIIAGFHRSGTSTLARLLNKAGLFLGSDLIGANASNPYGHYEDRAFVDIHNSILADHGLSWHVTEHFVPFVMSGKWQRMVDLADKRRRCQRLWGFKDPRVSFFLNHWKHILPDAKVCILHRHPLETIDSMERRQAWDLFQRRGPAHLHRRFWTDADHGLKMWNAYNKSLVRFAEAWPEDVLVLSFSQLRDGRNVVGEINLRWTMGLSEVHPDAFIDYSLLRTHPNRKTVYDRNRLREAQRLMKRLGRLSEVTDERIRR